MFFRLIDGFLNKDIYLGGLKFCEKSQFFKYFGFLGLVSSGSGSKVKVRIRLG